VGFDTFMRDNDNININININGLRFKTKEGDSPLGGLTLWLNDEQSKITNLTVLVDFPRCNRKIG